MLFSRFWYLLLTVIMTLCAAAALLGQGIINDRYDDALNDALRRDRAALDVQLALDARSRIDRLAFISVDGGFGSQLQQAASIPSDDKRLATLSAQVKRAMESHVKKLTEAGHGAPDIAMAVDNNGRIIAQLGPFVGNPPGGSLATYPLVRRVLQGYVRDDVWLYDRKVYRMAARPVMSGRDYAGAIVHGYLFDASLAQKLSENLQGASVGFFYGTQMIAGFTPTNEPAPPQEDLNAGLATALQDASLSSEGRTGLLPVGTANRGLYALLPGSTTTAKVGYAVARTAKMIESPLALFDSASQQDIDGLPLPVLGGGALLFALIGLLAVFLEHDRPMKSLQKATAAVAAGEEARLIITNFRGPFRGLADEINHSLERIAERASSQSQVATPKKANLDELLGPTANQSEAQPFFGFAADNAPPKVKAAPPAGPASPPPAPPPKPPAAPALAVPNVPPVPPAKPGAPPPPVAAAKATPNGTPSPASDEQVHFRQVYEQYLEVRRQCSEPTDGLTFEKLEATLLKTRDQVLAKHEGQSVRFTVYVKEGKAALKASPIR